MPVLEVTAAAAEKARQLLERDARPHDALRVRVVDGGCSGMRYELVFDGEVRPDDEESEQHGLRVLVDAESAETTCGCGESFNVV